MISTKRQIEIYENSTARRSMRMQDTIIQLKALGQMPDSLTGNPAGELVSKYDELLIKVKTPLTE